MKDLRKRVVSAWQRHGPLRFFKLAAYNAWYRLGLLGRRASSNGDDFDTKHGTDTARVLEVGSLGIESPSARHAVRYQPSSAALVIEAIDGLDADLSSLTFIDFGSGKGRVVLLAASYPFKAVVGIELSRELHEIARQNVQRALPRGEYSRRVRLVCEDVATFTLPDTDLLCYLYNPFGPVVLAPLAERLSLHASRRGHRVFVIYVDPRHRDVFENAGDFRVIRDDPSVLVLGA